MSDIDPNLLRRAVEGDSEALSDLLTRHGPNVEKTLRIDAPWRTHIDSADVMQVTYIEAFCHIRDFDLARAERFEGWLRQLAENNLRDAIRGLTRQKRGGPAAPGGGRAAVDAHDEALLLFAGTTSTPSRVTRRKERATALTRALAKLPPDYAQVVRLLDIEGRAVSEAATALKRSHGAIHMLRARAHDRLRELLGPASEFLTQT